jgi:hypothetical protein
MKNTTVPTTARKVSHNFSRSAETAIAAILTMQSDVINPLISDPDTSSEDRRVLVRLFEKLADSADALHDLYPLQVV